MAVSHRQRRLFTPDEYLALERAADSKSEYLNGEIFAMSGGSPEHDTITTNLGGELHRQLKGKNCRVFSANMKVRVRPMPRSGRVSPKGLFSYPDLTVVCGEPLFHDTVRDVLVNPRVIFEVLSRSTEDFDRGQKRLLYQSLPSLSEYVLVAQAVPLVEHWVRTPDGSWAVSTLDQMGVTLVLQSISCTLALADIYDRLSFPVR